MSRELDETWLNRTLNQKPLSRSSLGRPGNFQPFPQHIRLLVTFEALAWRSTLGVLCQLGVDCAICERCFDPFVNSAIALRRAQVIPRMMNGHRQTVGPIRIMRH